MSAPRTVFHEEQIEGFPVVYQRGNDVRRFGIRMRSIIVHADDGVQYHADWILTPFLHPLIIALAIPILRKRATMYLLALKETDHGKETEDDKGEGGSGA